MSLRQSRAMIKSLTEAQKALLPVYAEKWKKLALENKRVDRPKAENLLNEAYTKAGLIPPKRILWFSSKEEMLLYAACIKRNTKHPAFASVSDSVWASVWASAWASVGASVGDSVSDSVRDPVWDSVWDSVRDSVRDPVWDSVWDPVSASVWDSVYASVSDSICWYANLARYDYFRNVCGLTEETEKLFGFITFAQNCGSFYAMKNFALLCDDSKY